MADIINLKTVRKQKARAAREDKAAENRSLFGRTKAEKQLTEEQLAKAGRHLDSHKLPDE